MLEVLSMHDAILSRLAERMPGGWVVRAAFDLDDEAAKATKQMALLIFDGAQPVDEPLARNASVLDVDWTVAVCARHGSGVARGEQARAQALVAANVAYEALAGWQPAGAVRPMKLIGIDAADYEPPVAIVPLRFRARAISSVPQTT